MKRPNGEFEQLLYQKLQYFLKIVFFYVKNLSCKIQSQWLTQTFIKEVKLVQIISLRKSCFLIYATFKTQMFNFQEFIGQLYDFPINFFSIRFIIFWIIQQAIQQILETILAFLDRTQAEQLDMAHSSLIKSTGLHSIMMFLLVIIYTFLQK
ncbi:unnamed protein product [Paramecium sonneborni]|uniref:Transmembrane protein n=1 Tax=Paramecium sonneborni TaxID=65129 RepID=A0A8S1QNQ6_9CILI|nr:unnamed protein product [Paramecium sonneborni]